MKISVVFIQLLLENVSSRVNTFLKYVLVSLLNILAGKVANPIRQGPSPGWDFARQGFPEAHSVWGVCHLQQYVTSVDQWSMNESTNAEG